jgi:tRNA-2-methylthio-N6-dimethylallyladenosine synthase
MTDDLITAHADLPKLMPYLHLPVQAGADRILKAMNRKHSAESYIRLIERIRAARPDIAISGDFIVGFPGETEAEFQATLDLADTVGYASAFSFKYSARPGTPAAELETVTEDVSSERLQRLQALLNRDRARFADSLVGATLPVRFEKQGREPGQMIGRSPYLQSVVVQADQAAKGRILPVDITDTLPNALAGRLS